jgi:hypothetical protein
VEGSIREAKGGEQSEVTNGERRTVPGDSNSRKYKADFQEIRRLWKMELAG